MRMSADLSRLTSFIAGVGGEIRGNNLYVYAFNNPIMYSDPNGNWTSWNDISFSIRDYINDIIAYFEGKAKL